MDGAFERAVAVVLDHEGGFADDAADPGGATNYGISLRFLRRLGDLDGDGYLDGDLDKDGDVDADDIRKLTADGAKELYRRQWWGRYRYGEIVYWPVAAKLLDLSVNMGPRQAHVVMQRALRTTAQPVAEDGILGPKTLAAINATADVALLAAMRSEAAGFYRLLAETRPQLRRYTEGWLNRAYS